MCGSHANVDHLIFLRWPSTKSKSEDFKIQSYKQLNFEICTQGDRFTQNGGRRVGRHDAGLRSHQGGLRGAQERLLPGSKRNLTLPIGTPTEISSPDRLASVPIYLRSRREKEEGSPKGKGVPSTKTKERQTDRDRDRETVVSTLLRYCLETASQALRNTL